MLELTLAAQVSCAPGAVSCTDEPGFPWQFLVGFVLLILAVIVIFNVVRKD
jgi:hypothetical protein